MSELFKEPWEQEYLKKASEFEKICQKRDALGYEYDLQGSAHASEYAIKFLRKVSLSSKVLIVIFTLIVLAGHYRAEHSDIIIKVDGGEFHHVTPAQVQ